MEYSSNKLSKMSGVSARTLRHYDEIDLLKPIRIASSGYRIYGQAEVDKLQQILFYRELGLKLKEIKIILSAPDFDKKQTLLNHLIKLHEKREHLYKLMQNVSRSLAAMNGEIDITDYEKFDGFKLVGR